MFFCTLPLDLVLLVLRLLTIGDALSLFATCRYFHTMEWREFWVYVNIDMRKLPCPPGRPSIDHSTYSTQDLRARAIKSWRTQIAWRLSDFRPRRVHSISVNYDVFQLVTVPWSRLVVVVSRVKIQLQDWSSGRVNDIVLPLNPTLVVFSAKLVWVESIGRNALIVHLTKRRDLGQHELHFFAIDVPNQATSHLATILVPSALTHVDFRGKHLALICKCVGSASQILSFEMQFGSAVSCVAQPRIRIQTLDPIRHVSFTIVNPTRFLVAGPAGLSLFEIPAEAFTYPEDRTLQSEALASPPIGHLLRVGGGVPLISVASGNYLRCLKLNPEGLQVTQRRLVDRVPVYLGITCGFRIGVYRRPYSIPSFTTFPLADAAEDLHPFLHHADYSVRHNGSIHYSYDMLESLEVDSLQIDEEGGVLCFVLKTHFKATARMLRGNKKESERFYYKPHDASEYTYLPTSRYANFFDMFSATPLDIILLIVRLLTIGDALSLLATCRRLRKAECRSFWVHTWPPFSRLQYLDYGCSPSSCGEGMANSPFGALDVTPGGGWKYRHFCPQLAHGAAKVFWVEALGSNILSVHLAMRRDRPQSELHFFKIHIEDGMCSALVALMVPSGLTHVDLRGNCLALLSHDTGRVCRIFSYNVEFGNNVVLSSKPTVRIMCRDPVVHTSFAIMADTQFLVAGPSGVSVYQIPVEAFELEEKRTWWTPVTWCHDFEDREALSSPPLGPRLDGEDSTSISIVSGNYIRRVTVTGPSFRISQRGLVERVPMYLGIASGFHVGVYRRPYLMPSFTTFLLAENEESFHPFLHDTDYSVGRKGSVRYRHAVVESLEPASLQIDEGQGLIMFVLRTHAEGTAKVVILELV
ncbi:hypothetical protein B0H11DRAFT_1912368 [Mycena galericulata]|nr:hypothetical protein B0H11DRAFT_1912368 [Mycena galericulata]